MGSTFNLGSGNQFNNCPIGNGTIMYTTSSHSFLSNDNWDELKYLLEKKFDGIHLSHNESQILHNAQTYVTQKDEGKFLKFIRDNKNSFIVSTLSNLVSEGLEFLFIGL